MELGCGDYALGRELGLQVIGEAWKPPAVDISAASGCNLQQGYLFATP